IEEEPACPRPPADDAERVGGVAVLRPRLCQIGSTSLYMGKRRKRWIPARDRVEPAAPFVRLAPPRRFNGLPGALEYGLATCRDEILIEKHDRVVAGVALAADEPRLGVDGQPFGRQKLAHAGVIRHLRKRPRVRPTAPTAARPAVVGRLV